MLHAALLEAQWHGVQWRRRQHIEKYARCKKVHQQRDLYWHRAILVLVSSHAQISNGKKSYLRFGLSESSDDASTSGSRSAAKP